MKKIFFCIFACVIALASFGSVCAYAATAETILSVHFDLYPNKDGTLDVTEVWSVKYGGTGESFTRWIDTPEGGLDALYGYSSISNVTALVNGSKDNVENLTSEFSADGKSFDITVESVEAAEEMEYTFSYTVNGALKKQGNDVRLAYMLIGNYLQFTCNNVTATIQFPDEISVEDIAVNAEDGTAVDMNCVNYDMGRVYTTFGVDVSVASDIFDTSAMVKYSPFKNSLKAFGQSIIKVGGVLLAVAAAVAVVILVLFYEKIRRFSVEKNAKNSTEAVDALPEGISPCKAYKMLVPYSRINPVSTSKKVPALFAMAILECMEKGYIVRKDDELIVGIPENEDEAYIMSVLNFLVSMSEKKFNRYVIDSDFGEKVMAECASQYDNIANYLASFYALIPAMDSKFLKDEANRKAYTDCFVLKNAIRKENCRCTFAECADAVLDCAKVSDKQIFAMLFSNKIFDASGRDCTAVIAKSIKAMYDVFVKSK